MTTTLTPPTRRLTLDEWLAQPDSEPASEYVCGEVLPKPMPNLPHGVLQLFFGAVLREWLRQHRLGRVAVELRCVFGPPTGTRGYVPDLAFVSFERLGRGDLRLVVPYRQAPDLAIEVLSPDQDMVRFLEKIVFYLHFGVRLVWVVDPRGETVTVLSPTAEPVTLGVADTLDGRDVLPGFSLPVVDIFAELAAEPADEAEPAPPAC